MPIVFRKGATHKSRRRAAVQLFVSVPITGASELSVAVSAGKGFVDALVYGAHVADEVFSAGECLCRAFGASELGLCLLAFAGHFYWWFSDSLGLLE
jgi:hypothetical protein